MNFWGAEVEKVDRRLEDWKNFGTTNLRSLPISFFFFFSMQRHYYHRRVKERLLVGKGGGRKSGSKSNGRAGLWWGLYEEKCGITREVGVEISRGIESLYVILLLEVNIGYMEMADTLIERHIIRHRLDFCLPFISTFI